MTPEFTLRDELDSKVIDALHDAIFKFNKGKITLDQLSFGVDLVFAAVNGVASRVVFDAITEISDVIDAEKEKAK